MRSPRTDGEQRRWPFRVLGGLLLRLVVGLASVSLIALLVLGIAVNQILNAYFEEQESRRLDQAADAIQRLFPEFLAQVPPTDLAVREIREGVLIPRVARAFADQLPGTIAVSNPDGAVFFRTEPSNVDRLREQGLSADPLIPPERREVPVQLLQADPLAGPDGVLRLSIELSQPFTSRQQTLDSVRGALVGAGLLALVVSVLVGTLAARSVTGPLARLRRASARLAQGDLDERVPPLGMVELDQLADQFNVMADRLRESLTMLSNDRDRLREFVADVSHELRTPIAALRTFTELQSDGEVDGATRREFLERSTEQISRLEWLSTNLLDLSRIEAGIFPLDMRHADLRDPVRSAAEAHARLAEARQIALTTEVPGVPVELRFDRQRIVQLVSNLLGNALKFTSSGGSVELRLTDRPEGAVIEVRDTGAGIPADELPRIFERFYRGTNTGAARGAGSGLGLAIAKSIVEMHDGGIEVESTPRKGSVFRVVLPRRVEPGGFVARDREIRPGAVGDRAVADRAVADREKINETSR